MKRDFRASWAPEISRRFSRLSSWAFLWAVHPEMPLGSLWDQTTPLLCSRHWLQPAPVPRSVTAGAGLFSLLSRGATAGRAWRARRYSRDTRPGQRPAILAVIPVLGSVRLSGRARDRSVSPTGRRLGAGVEGEYYFRYTPTCPANDTKKRGTCHLPASNPD